MTRIKTQKELQTLYPEHHKVLLGYWLSGYNTKEHLDGLAQKLKLTRKKPEKSRTRFYIKKLQEGRKKAGPGLIYYERAVQTKTVLVFRCYGGEDLTGIIHKDGGDRFTLHVDERRKVVWKTDFQYAFKAESREGVEQAVQIDEEVRKQGLQPIIPAAERYHIPDKELLSCQRKGLRLRLTMRGGEALEGRVEWFGAFDVKLELASGKSVVVFRHAVLRHEVGRDGRESSTPERSRGEKGK
jgi:sRNA-binding regulator protein Hfq